MLRLLSFLFILTTIIIFITVCNLRSPDTGAAAEPKVQSIPERAETLDARLSSKGHKVGDKVFIRIFKNSKELELWMMSKGERRYTLFETYPICYFSGSLGPKLKEGDKQSPEGFYAVGKSQLNPGSQFYKSFNLGFPNQYEREMKYTGSYLMVHGNCVSVGCYAMTDPQMWEIYKLVEAALNNGQSYFRVHIFPFKLTSENLAKYKEHKWIEFWKMMQLGYQYFEDHHTPPNIEVVNKRYVID